MINRVPVLLVGLLASTLIGCGLIRDTSDNHLKSREMPPMVVTDDMDTEALGQLYPVPPITQVQTEEEGFEVPRPQPISANVFEETVKIQSFGDSRWILINKPPEEIWPRVRNILNRSGIPTQNVDAAHGIIETIWIKFKNDDSTSHRFKFTIEPAIQINSTEVRILQQQTPAGTEEGNFTWPAHSDDDGREKEMMDIISNALAADISGPSVSLLAQSIGGEDKVELVNPKVADSYLNIKLPYDRAWASLVYSLSRGGFSIEDKDQTAGTFQVDFLPISEKEDKPGFFRRWIPFLGKKEPEKQHYLVIVKQADDNTVQVRITDRDQHSLSKPLANKLLIVIRGNLT